MNEINPKENSLILKKVFLDFFLSSGFKNKGNIWFFDYGEAIVTFELNKSSWSYQYTLSAGIIIRFEPDQKLNPSERNCHLYVDCIHLESDVELRRKLFNLLDCHQDEVERNALKFIDYLKGTGIMELLTSLTSKEKLLAYFKEFGYKGVLRTRFYILEEFIRKLES